MQDILCVMFQSLRRQIAMRMWPLPPSGRRRLLPFYLTRHQLRERIRTAHDGEYLFFQVGALIEKISMIFFVFVIIDLYSHAGILIDRLVYDENKIELVQAWGKFVGPLTLVLAIGAYFRIRLAIDIRTEPLPLSFFDMGYIRRFSLKSLGVFSAFAVLFFLFIFPFSLIRPMEAAVPHTLRAFSDDGGVVLCWLGFMTIITGIGTSFTLALALICEKILRYPDVVKEEIGN